MRRADRLFQIIQILRRRRITTAAWLADDLEVSERTIYRDVRDLVLSGVPIEGEAGLGYVLRGFDLPPLMFSEEEIEALVLGARVVRSWADPALAEAARQALAKIEVVVPERLRGVIAHTSIFSPSFAASRETVETLGPLRRAVKEQRKIGFRYLDKSDRRTRRTVRPLCLAFVAPVWLLAAWCELRGAFRNFRVDRITELELLEETFVDEPGRGLDDFLAQVRGVGAGVKGPPSRSLAKTAARVKTST